MQSINFSNGFKIYAINGDENNTIKVNISDLNLLSRLKTVYNDITDLQEKYKDIKDPSPEQYTEVDTELKAKINYAFGTDICTSAFGEVNCMSFVETGKTLIASFMEAFIPIIEKDIEEYKQNVSKVKFNDSRIRKYTDPVISLENSNSQSTEKNDIKKLSQEEKDRILSEIFK